MKPRYTHSQEEKVALRKRVIELCAKESHSHGERKHEARDGPYYLDDEATTFQPPFPSNC
jgi:hypothetical protein